MNDRTLAPLSSISQRPWPSSRHERRALGILALIVAAAAAAGAIALGYPPVLGAAIAALGIPHLRSRRSPASTAGL